MDVDPSPPSSPREQADYDPYKRAEKLIQDIRFAKFCTEHKLKKRTSDCLLGMLKERAFILKDLHVDSIREIEKLISDSCKGKIREYDLWTEMDGLQEVKLYLRTLRQIIEDLLRHLGYRDLQYLHFEYRECNGERIFGPANGGLWWQITVRKIGQGHVLIALVVFQDGSWVKMNLSCEPLYGPSPPPSLQWPTPV
jgi:hypothetical protein